MRRFATIISTTVVFGLPLVAGTGCVQQDKYDKMLMTNKSLQEQMVALEQERDEAKASLDTVREALSRASSELNALKSKYNLSEEEMARMGKDYDELLRRVGALDFGPLPERLSRDLEQLAAQYPDVLTFDAKRGMIRFASDFTFALGSAELTSSAQSSIVALAKILNTPTASNFEARIVGHTDNVPINRPETRAKHPTNWHLSAHRAISVGDALISSGVAPNRIQVAGYGEYRPVVPNPPKGGAAQNRRVEIFLVPMHDVQPAVSATAKPRDVDEPMK
jgi:chemotaxis protein MotB